MTIDEPIPTHYHHPKSAVYIRVHSWFGTFYGFGQIHNDVCLPLCSALPVHLPLPTLATTDLFTVSIVQTFLEGHIIGIVQ